MVRWGTVEPSTARYSDDALGTPSDLDQADIGRSATRWGVTGHRARQT